MCFLFFSFAGDVLPVRPHTQTGGAEEFGEERVRRQGARLELGVELRAEHEGMHRARELGNLHQHAVGRSAGENKAGVFELLHIF